MPVKNIIPGQRVTKEKLQRSRELRREMTPAEKILWEELRGSKLGVRFRRQQVIQGFIVDFYCHWAGLVVEVDGDVHDLQREEDERREKVVNGLCHGFTDINGLRKFILHPGPFGMMRL